MQSSAQIPIRKHGVILCLTLCAISAFGAAEQTGVQVDTGFPGGNVKLERITGDSIRLRQERRDTEGWWFYWYFRVRGAEDRTLHFHFTDGEPVGVRGPAFSTDAGKSWRWLGTNTSTRAGFKYDFGKDAREVRFCFTIPYLQSNWEQFLRRHEGQPEVRSGVLCQSKKNRPVECLYVGAPGREPRHRVLVTARHHACETMASYALEGFLDTAILAQTKEGRWLSEHVDFLAIPFVDKDGVEDGDQGKDRHPRDHNRDYDGISIHPETAAIRRLVPEWSRGKLRAALDLHCPWIRGARNEMIYIVGSRSPALWKEQQRLGAILEALAQGPLPYRASDNLAFGLEWNTGSNYSAGKSSMAWAGELPGLRLALSLEIPYANARGAEVNPNAARAFGRDLARALARYLQEQSW